MRGCVGAFSNGRLQCHPYQAIHIKKRSLYGFKMTNCRNCGKPFKKTRDWQKFCSNVCRKSYHVSFPLLERRMDELERRVEELEKKR